MQRPDNVKVGDKFRATHNNPNYAPIPIGGVVYYAGGLTNSMGNFTCPHGWLRRIERNKLEPYTEPTATTSEKIAVHTPTQESYDRLMRLYDRKGRKWSSGDKPGKSDKWYVHGARTAIRHHDRFGYCDTYYYSDYGFKIITVDEAEQLLFPGEKKQYEPTELELGIDLSQENPLSFIKKTMSALQTLRNATFFTDSLGKKTNTKLDEARELADGFRATADRATMASTKIRSLISTIETAYDRQDIADYKENMGYLGQVLAYIEGDEESQVLSNLGKKEEKKVEKYDASI